MGRYVLWGAIFALLSLVAGATSHGDAQPDPGSSAVPVIATEMPATEPLGANPPRDPLGPYDPGPPSGLWQRADLTPAERRVLDHDDPTDWAAVNAFYASAAQQDFEKTLGLLAQRQLGLEDLGDVGVVP